MAMLAEPRRRQRIGPNPRGLFFQEDDQNRGRNMLQKMGWKDGEGLGLAQQGISEPIKPKIQQDSKGLGFDVKSDPWVAHNDKFSELLQSLNSTTEVVKEGENEGVDRLELEKKSKLSRSRIHYQKFIRNKDLSNCSTKDWSCIFGKSVDKVSCKEELQQPQLEEEDEKEKFVISGSMTDYFKHKFELKRSKHQFPETNGDNNFDIEDSTEKKIEIEGYINDNEEVLQVKVESDSIEGAEDAPSKKKKKHKKIKVEASDKTEQKMHVNIEVDSESNSLDSHGDSISNKRTKRKKIKAEASDLNDDNEKEMHVKMEVDSESNSLSNEIDTTSKKKKKKKAGASDDLDETEVESKEEVKMKSNTVDDEVYTTSNKKSKSLANNNDAEEDKSLVNNDIMSFNSGANDNPQLSSDRKKKKKRKAGETDVLNQEPVIDVNQIKIEAADSSIFDEKSLRKKNKRNGTSNDISFDIENGKLEEGRECEENVFKSISDEPAKKKDKRKSPIVEDNLEVPEEEKFISRGSMVDYFKQKMTEKQKNSKILHESGDTQKQNEYNLEKSVINNTVELVKKKKKNKVNPSIHEDEYNTSCISNDGIDSISKIQEFLKDDKKCDVTEIITSDCIDEPIKKKKKKSKICRVETETTIEVSQEEKFISRGNMFDYFKQKMMEKERNAKLAQKDTESEKEQMTIDMSEGNIEANVEEVSKRKKKHKIVDTISEDEPIKKKKKSKTEVSISSEEEVVKKENEGVLPEDGVEDSNSEQHVKSKKEKSKKKKQKLSSDEMEKIECENVEESVISNEVLTKKKKKSKKSESTSCESAKEEEVNIENNKVEVGELLPKNSDETGQRVGEMCQSTLEDGMNSLKTKKFFWDPETVKSIASKYVGSNILDIPGYLHCNS